MSRKDVPSYRKHKQSGQAIVTLTNSLGSRCDVLLGKYGSKASREKYARVIAEWEARERNLPPPTAADLTIAHLTAAFWPHVEQHYRHADGTETTEVAEYRLSLRPLTYLYGNTVAKQFGPLALSKVWLARKSAEKSV
jgi:hypothetical protein